MNRKFFRDLTLIKKIVVIFIVSVMIPVVIIVQVIISKSKEKIIEQTVSISESFVSKIANNLSEVFDEQIDIVKRICFYDQNLKNMLRIRKRNNAIDNIEYYKYFIEKYEVDLIKNKVDLKIYYFQDTIIQNYTTFIKVDDEMRNTVAFKMMENSEELFSWGYDFESQKIFVSGKIIDADGEIAGIAVVSLGFGEIISLVSNEEVSKWDDILLVDGYGNQVISTTSKLDIDPGFLEETMNTKNEKEALDYQNEYKVIHKSLKTEDNYVDWKIVTFISIKEITRDANRVKNEFLFVSVIVISISFSLFLWNIRGIAKRINALTEQMKEVSMGNFKEIQYDHSNTELGAMTKSFNRMVLNLDTLINENYEKNLRLREMETKRREAELYALQSQIQPHFLFNTLESIRMKLASGNLSESDEMILNLAKCLRKTLSWHSAMIPIAEELDLAVSYLKVQKLRFRDKFDYSVHCDVEEMEKHEIPKLIIQPLVENSVLHGMETSMHFVMIEIDIHKSEDEIIIKVADNGKGIEKERLCEINRGLAGISSSQSEEHIGLRNINDRLVLYYGEAYRLNIVSGIEVGTEILLKIPLDKGVKNNHVENVYCG